MEVDRARNVIRRAIDADVFPVAAIDVGSSTGTIWRESFGTPAATPFDLASLTKVIATTSIVMQSVSDGRVRLEERIGSIFPEWQGADREAVSVIDLFEHTAGLPATLVSAPANRHGFQSAICGAPLAYLPGSRSMYTNLGFILLGFLAADRGRASLVEQFEVIRCRISKVEPEIAQEQLTFCLARGSRCCAAPTKPMWHDARSGRLLIGEVHDKRAAVLGGAAGHAGLFGTAASVAAFARAVLRAARDDMSVPTFLSPKGVAQAAARNSCHAKRRYLSWNRMVPNASCGTRMSPAAFGHVGFTGTSLWIDPERDRYFVLLTNRACGDGTLDDMRAVRRAFHDALAARTQ